MLGPRLITEALCGHSCPRRAARAGRGRREGGEAGAHGAFSPAFLRDLHSAVVPEASPAASPTSCTTNTHCQAHPAAPFGLFSFCFATLSCDRGDAIPTIIVFPFLPVSNTGRPVLMCHLKLQLASQRLPPDPTPSPKHRVRNLSTRISRPRAASEITLPSLRPGLLKPGLASGSSPSPSR